MSFVYFLLILHFARFEAYSNQLFTIAKAYSQDFKCLWYENRKNDNYTELRTDDLIEKDVEDPYDAIQKDLHKFLYGKDINHEVQDGADLNKLVQPVILPQNLLQFVSGNAFRSELFKNKSGVHLISPEFVLKGYCVLNITKDYMQTAVNAFAIFLYGTRQDILRLPANYVLQSARTISMMHIEREKLTATWEVVKGAKRTFDVSYETLEQYRPLFKYVDGKEIAKLDLNDERILRYIGTHPDLNRHQVGVVASKFTSINKRWNETQYLNKMNNLLCGMPITFMRGISSNSYLQLSHQALGKSNSWNAQDVSRLGLLLAEVDESQLSAINPEAMAGIAPQVMLIMSPEKLRYFSELQLRYLGHKSLNILTRKLKKYEEVVLLNGNCDNGKTYIILVSCIVLKCLLYN